MKHSTLITASLVAMTWSVVLQGAAHRVAGQPPEETLKVMRQVADWQIDNPSKHNPLDWTHGALYPGYTALGDLVPETKYREEMMMTGLKNQWKHWNRIYHADDYAVLQAWAEMYDLYRDPAMIEPGLKMFDFILANPAKCEVSDIRHGWKGKEKQDNQEMRWWWCDALFMGPPAWAKFWDITDNKAYLDFMVKEWKATSGYLYDKKECLYYRDGTYLPEKRLEANGKKIFWSRGNGWVLGGLVRVLQVMPSDHPDRKFFEGQFKDMCKRIIEIQPADGVWRASFLDPDSFPIQETSGTAFIIYALAWGVNQGLLDADKAEPAFRKAYKMLCSFIESDGKLTHVQPIGADPQKFDQTKTEIYGVGAFLMGASEIYKMDLLRTKPNGIVKVENESRVFLPDYTVEVEWDDVLEKVPGATPDTIGVMDSTAARWLLSQVVFKEGKPDKLLFQTRLHSKQTKKFILVGGIDRKALPLPTRKTFARFVPERMDDFAWENDRTMYRAYGPALLAKDGPTKMGSGVDVFGKATRGPIIDKIFKEKNYHSPDLGYAIDAYKVGTGPGCGGTAVYADNQYKSAQAFVKQEVLANGPVRSTFKLTYETGEVRLISIDLGSDFYFLKARFPEKCTPAVGVTHRPGEQVSVLSGRGWYAGWEPMDGVPGHTGVALIVDDGRAPEIRGEAAWVRGERGKEVEAYAGSCWSNGKDYKTAAEWFAAVEKFRLQCDADVDVD